MNFIPSIKFLASSILLNSLEYPFLVSSKVIFIGQFLSRGFSFFAVNFIPKVSNISAKSLESLIKSLFISFSDCSDKFVNSLRLRLVKLETHSINLSGGMLIPWI